MDLSESLFLKQLENQENNIYSSFTVKPKNYSGRRSRKGTGDTDRAGRTGTGVIGKRDENEKSGIKDYFLW